jgi:hypothetical protein
MLRLTTDRNSEARADALPAFGPPTWAVLVFFRLNSELPAFPLFALSPIPSAQLFVAAGLLTVPLDPLTAAFFAGRLVSYSLYVGAASAARDSLGSVLGDAFGSPLGIAVQVAMFAGLVLLLRFDWVGLLRRRTGGRAANGAAA